MNTFPYRTVTPMVSPVQATLILEPHPYDSVGIACEYNYFG